MLLEEFDELDLNNDGQLSLQEARVLLGNLTTAEFAALDTNNDGFLTESELEGNPASGGCKLSFSGTVDQSKKLISDLFLLGVTVLSASGYSRASSTSK